MIGRRVFLGVIAGAGALLGAGCASNPNEGYSFEKPFDASKRTIAVNMFQNTTYIHGLEVQLTDAVVKQIQQSTPWTVVNGPGADTVLTGSISDFQMRKLTTQPVSGIAEQLAVAVTVDYEWRDNRTGKALLQRRGQRAADTFVPALGVGERIDLAERSAVEEAAKLIVASLQSGW